jgi:Xaa-Pro aminopeptidase
MLAQGLDGVLISSLPNIRYLSGFSGSNALLVVTARTAWFITDGRYTLQSRHEVTGFRRCITRDPFPETIARRRLLRGSRILGFEAHDVTIAQHRALKHFLQGQVLRPTVDLVESIALTKDPQEIALLKKAISISDRTFAEILNNIRPGMRENEIAARISFLQKSAGADGDAFDTIVASGPRAALPHARPSGRKVRDGDVVILDFGCTVGGYHSDITRTVAIGSASRKAREIYSVVRSAGEEAIKVARSGMPVRELDGVARRHIRRAGYGRCFSHSLGHGLGLHIHERPSVSPLGKETLAAGSVITIEPGVYLPGWGGVRIEDDVLVTERGCRVLTKSSKELMIL